MQPLPYHGSSSDFFQAEPEVVLKAPMRIRVQNENRKALEEQNIKAIDIERRILEVLGKHPRIVPYLGFDQSGIYLAKAKLGNLQNYIDSYHTELHPLQRYKICEQVTEAVVHVHERGVIHSDLRLENVLVEQVNESSVSVWLCDFGGSTCEHLGLDGGHLPDTPFFNPRLRWLSTQATDIFSLGSIFYTVQTGYWPFMTSPPQWSSYSEKQAYELKVEDLFGAGSFPDLSDVKGGNVIKGCWQQQYKTAVEVLQAIRLEI